MSLKVIPLVTARFSVQLPAQATALNHLTQRWVMSSPFEKTPIVTQHLCVIGHSSSQHRLMSDYRLDERLQGRGGRQAAERVLPHVVQRMEEGASALGSSSRCKTERRSWCALRAQVRDCLQSHTP